MTYILGINQLGINAIICDTRVTTWRSEKRVSGANIALKSGLLFPGCIYGITGDIDSARSFIIECKEILTGKGTLLSFWDKFIGFIEIFRNRHKTGKFTLLLSSRNHGHPKFYTLDFPSGELAEVGRFVTLGSGKQILDVHVDNLYNKRSTIIDKVILENNIPEFTFPYFYCLWLNEISLGMDASTLEEYDTGGVFHFLWQDSKGEHSQHPAVYVLNDADIKNKIIYEYIFRVAFSEGALIYENPIQNEMEILIESAARPILGVSLKHREAITREAKKLPYYYFCGIGFANPSYRGEFGFHVTTKRDYIVKRDGWMDDRHRRLIASKFERNFRLEKR